MKVLMLGWELPPYNSGGLGIACYELCKSLSKKNIDIEFILPYRADHNIDFMKVTSASDLTSSEILENFNAYNGGVNPNSTIHEQLTQFEQSTLKLTESNEYDIVHAHDWLTFKAAIRLKSTRKWPIILHVHSVESDRAGSKYGNPFVKEIEAIALQMADRIVAVSEHTKRCIMEDYSIPADKIEVIHNSINADTIQPMAEANEYVYLETLKQFGYKTVVNIGRLTIQKGLPNLLLAARKVIDKVPNTFFLIVGSGEMMYELIEMSADLKIGQNVIFTDFQRGKRWRDAYSIGDLFVMPSVSEPFGLTPLEAISYGTPALISKQSGVSEVLNNCLKVDFWDVDEMANQISNVLLSDQLKNELWQNSFNELSKLSWDNSSEKVIELYNKSKGLVLA